MLKEKKLKDGSILTLRNPKEEDAEAIISYLNRVGGESDNLLFGENEFHLTVEEEKEYIRRTNEDPNSLMIVGIIDHHLVSIGQIQSYRRKRIAHNSELAISVRKDYWGKGVGSAVMEELIHFAEKHPVIKYVHLGVKAENEKAIRLYEKFGFKKIGTHKKFFHMNGKFYDEILMDLYI